MTQIGLDAGHYMGDGRVPGAYTRQLGTEDEYILNIRTYKTVEAALRAAGYTVTDIGQQSYSVVTRAKRAGASGCDAVLSLHHNAGGGRGITLFRHNNGVLGSQSLAMQNALYQYLKNVNAGDRANPVAAAELGVINCSNTKCPAVLIECAFMDNQTDVNLINSASYNERIARAIVDGLNSYFGKTALKQNTDVSRPAALTVTRKYDTWAYARVRGLTEEDSYLNVRTGPGTEYPAVRQLTNGNEVDVLEIYSNGWAKINIIDTQYYVYGGYLAITERLQTSTKPSYAEWTGRVHGTGSLGLIVRTGPGKDYARLKSYPKLYDGNMVAVMEEKNGYYQVRISNSKAGTHIGYGSKEYIERA